jgi:hypothetical protein
MVFEQSLAAIDPQQLAADSGVTRAMVPRFRAAVPFIIRPHLLTEQLRGMDCMCGTRSGLAIPPDYGALRGLGFDPSTLDLNSLDVPSAGSGNVSVLQDIAVGVNFIPGIGQIASVAITTFTSLLNQFEAWFGLGAGRREADMITPTQNNTMQALGGITNQILTGQTPTLDTLNNLYRQVWMLGVAFQEFVLQKQFIDRRASGQALNTVMPYVDGSCGYPVPVGYTATPGQQNCLSWGDGTIGGVGQNGMLGALSRAIQGQGGTPQALPNLHTAANQGIRLSSIPLPNTILGLSTPMVFALGIGALLLYKKGVF